MIHYLAYGSNLHPVRLRERVPSATPLAVVELPGHRLRFDKWSRDGSLKCSLSRAEDDASPAWGVLYALEPAEVAALDLAEGLGNGYDKTALLVPHRGMSYPAFTYVADPAHRRDSGAAYDWYVDLVVEGMRHFGMPSAYVSAAAATPVAADVERERAERNAALLAAVRDYSRAVPWTKGDG